MISKRYNILLGSVEIHSKIVTSTKKSVKYWNYQESREIFKLTELSEVFELSYIAVIQWSDKIEKFLDHQIFSKRCGIRIAWDICVSRNCVKYLHEQDWVKQSNSALSCQILRQTKSECPKMGQIQDFFRSYFSTFWLVEPKCTEIWS